MDLHNLSFPVYIVDAFVRTGANKFSGNPAAVVVLNRDDDIDDKVKQEMASEINQPATAFISQGWTSGMDSNNNGPSNWTIKWFSAQSELFLCGHASLAASSVIFSKFAPNLTSLTLEARRRGGQKLEVLFDPETGIISLDFPASPPSRLSMIDFPWVQDLVQKTIGSSSNLTMEDVKYSELGIGTKILLRLKSFPEWDSEELIRCVTPDIKGMMDVVPQSFKLTGVGVTIENNQKKEENETPLFYSRFFAPWVGIDEDFVCGSLHSILAPYWSKELGKGNDLMLSRFASTRTGDLLVRLLGNNKVMISGRTKLSLEGTLFK